jgi:hypothetical protein
MLELAGQPSKQTGRRLRSAAPTAAAPARASVRPKRGSQREPGRRFAMIVAIGFWETFLSMIVAAAAAVGFVLLFLLPLLGLGYLLFCFIALAGDRTVE